jgi:hypothetical protein
VNHGTSLLTVPDGWPRNAVIGTLVDVQRRRGHWLVFVVECNAVRYEIPYSLKYAVGVGYLRGLSGITSHNLEDHLPLVVGKRVQAEALASVTRAGVEWVRYSVVAV